jgi:phytoene dehydrogenase-like protein
MAPRGGDSIIADLTGLIGGVEVGEIGRQVNGPPQLARRFNAIDGNVFHVDPFVPRFGPLRPGPGLGGYRAPVEGLYFTGAGTHPSPGICGAPGKLSAQTVLRDLHRE